MNKHFTGLIENRAGVIVFVLAFGVYAAIIPRLLRYTEPPTGDQPYYLQTAISILDDHDLLERNNYERGDYQRFYPVSFGGRFVGIYAPAPLPPGGHIGVTVNRPPNEIYSKHGWALSLLILPGWVIGERLTPKGGWPGAVFAMALLGALLASQVFALVWQATRTLWIALAVALTLALSVPQAPLSLLIFPEVPAALLTVYAFRRLLRDDNQPWQWLLAAVCIAVLPWLHVRFLMIALPLAVFGLAQVWQKRTALFLLPLVTSAVAFVATNVYLYGSLLPSAANHAGFQDLKNVDDQMRLVMAMGGLLVDRQWGLLVYAPVFLLAVAGAVVMWRKYRRELLWLLAVILPYGLVVAMYDVWWGEWGPPARYLMPVVPLLALPLGYALLEARHRRTFVATYAVLAGLSIAIMAAMVTALNPVSRNYPPSFFNHPNGDAGLWRWLQINVGVDVSAYTPAIVQWFSNPSESYPLLSTFFCLSFLAVIATIATTATVEP